VRTRFAPPRFQRKLFIRWKLADFGNVKSGAL
jgi:hypothetical protein